MADKHRKKPYGPSPHGRSWGDTPWEQAYKLPGSIHVSIGKKILSGMNWQKLVPCREKLVLEDEKSCIFAAEVPEELLLIYVGPPAFSGGINKIIGLKPMCRYQFSLIDPKDANIKSRFEFGTDESGTGSFQEHFWRIVPVWQDWIILVKEKR